MVHPLKAIAQQYYDLQGRLEDTKQGYDFARNLSKDIRTRCALIGSGASNLEMRVGLILQFAEYEFIKEDIAYAKEEGLSYHTTGAMMYWLTHRKDHTFLEALGKVVWTRSDAAGDAVLSSTNHQT